MQHDHAAVWNGVLQTVLDTGESQTLFFSLPASDGEQFFHARIVPERSETGTVETVMSIARNFTDRRGVEQQLRETNVQLSQALAQLKSTQQQMFQQARLSAVGQIASGIAHDFNNALVPILGLSELLVRHPETRQNEGQLNEALTDIHSAAQNARETIKRLRGFYSPDDTAEYAPCSLNDIIDTAISLTQPRWKEELEAEGRIVEVHRILHDIPLIHGNESELGQTLANLILNAADAMPQGGDITIRSRFDGKWIIAEVSDTGTGMDDKTVQNCMEPFYTTKGEYGTGMGLAVAIGTVRSHGGSLSVTSKLGEGTVMSIRLPMPSDSDMDISPEAPVHIDTLLDVLVVDDEPWSRSMMERFLKPNGHNVECASSGAEGVKMFRAGNYSLVISDRAMPDMSGDMVVETIRQFDPDVPIIMLTGFGDIMNETGDIPAGVDLVLGKPVTVEELIAGIADVITP
jgi:signal transduction histidine kinase